MDLLVKKMRELKMWSLYEAIRAADELVPREYRDFPWEWNSLNHGKVVCGCQEELDCYLSAYGEMHIAKLNQAFWHLRQWFAWDAPRSGVNVIDWGCGQGIATCALSEYFNASGFFLPIQHIGLVEVSAIALNRAREFVRLHGYSPDIVNTANAYFEQVNANCVAGNRCFPTIHLLSNILDVDCVNLGTVAHLVLDSTGPMGGWVVCVGPVDGVRMRARWFARYFGNVAIIAGQCFPKNEFQYFWRGMRKTCSLELIVFRLPAAYRSAVVMGWPPTVMVTNPFLAGFSV